MLYLVFGTIVTCLCFHYIRTGTVFIEILPSCFDVHPLRTQCTWTVYCTVERVSSTRPAANDGSVRIGPNVAEPFSTVTFDSERAVTDGRRQRLSIVSRARSCRNRVYFVTIRFPFFPAHGTWECTRLARYKRVR